MSKANIGVRMLTYRARHKLSQTALAQLIDESVMTIYRTENGICKPHRATEIRLTEKMDKLEAEEGGKDTND